MFSRSVCSQNVSLLRLKILCKISPFQPDKLRCFSTSNEYDIIIAGGGMVGTTLACTLGKNKKLDNLKILMLESTKQSNWEPKEIYSKRVSALNPSTYELLKKIDAWKHIEAVRYGVIKKLQVWDALSDAMISFHNDDLSDTVAYVVENNLVISAAQKEVANTKVEILHEAKIKELKMPSHVDEMVILELEDGRKFVSKLLIGCDGAHSKIRDGMGVHYIAWNYNQTSVVATVHLSEETENVVAWQRFLPTGPIALLPLTNKLSSLVWTTNPDHAKQLVKFTKEQFIDAVNEGFWKDYAPDSFVTNATNAFNEFLKVFKLPSNAIRQLPPSIKGFDEKSRAAFPLGFGHATCYIKPGVALAGDAAHRIHPLAGQGVNLGFGDIISLEKILSDANYSGEKVGSLSSLRKYETERQRHNVPTMLAIDGIQKLYNTDFTPVVLLRSLGLQFTHALSPLKKALIGQASR